MVTFSNCKYNHWKLLLTLKNHRKIVRLEQKMEHITDLMGDTASTAEVARAMHQVLSLHRRYLKPHPRSLSPQSEKRLLQLAEIRFRALLGPCRWVNERAGVTMADICRVYHDNECLHACRAGQLHVEYDEPEQIIVQMLVEECARLLTADQVG